ncbi:hypothetical protein E5C33_07245 [Stenotrophomonas maltophilia]|uniref:hypothetical protein n=1 Tax=Stenotrophomonas maltophilia TaxID=40324 RepID=UPI001076BA1E|nr:hypothetical protein [Stenotrophomonas maltophilia]TFZ46065.1 hypothetical protein E5C33_07245 [Stenotrophomonas maltophilia]
MRTDLWDQFGELVGGSPGLLAAVTAHNADGTSTLTTYDGVQMRAFGQLQLAIPNNAWMRGARLWEVSPNVPLAEV